MNGRRIIVEGRVQGVWFRAFTRRVARRLGVVGWVRNRPDGTVEVMAAAEDEVLDQLERELRQGPSAAEVTALQSEPLDRLPQGSEFNIVD